MQVSQDIRQSSWLLLSHNSAVGGFKEAVGLVFQGRVTFLVVRFLFQSKYEVARACYFCFVVLQLACSKETGLPIDSRLRCTQSTSVYTAFRALAKGCISRTVEGKGNSVVYRHNNR